MKETFDDAKAGDQLSAREMNKLFALAEKLANESPLSGEGAAETNTGGIKGRAVKQGRIVMVRMTVNVLPKSSELYDWAGIEADLENEGHNAIVQLWDESQNLWVDTGNEGETDAERVTVTLADDATGWRPLLKNERLPVVYSKNVEAYVPLEGKESSIVVITSGPDADGYYLGQYLVWDSDNEAWVNRGDCYIMDVGTGASGSGGTGFSGTVP